MVLQDAVQMEMALASLSCNRKQETNSKNGGDGGELQTVYTPANQITLPPPFIAMHSNGNPRIPNPRVKISSLFRVRSASSLYSDPTKVGG